MQRIKLTGGNGDVVIISANNDTEALPGIFTVNANGKKVKFSPGNLYWDGSKYSFEEHQYDYPTEWNPNHVGHFFWSKNAADAHKETYVVENPSESDIFFAADDGAVDGYTVLSRDEWDYLSEHSLAKNSSDENVFIIAGKKCVILKPDGFNSTVADGYTADEWAVAETSGLVALPFAGHRYGTVFGSAGSFGFFWSGTLYGSRFACRAYFSLDRVSSDMFYRHYNFPIRLVSVQ